MWRSTGTWYPYLARGVVADLVGFGLLAGGGLAVRARVKHETAICLALIGLVVVASPQLALPEPAWWALFLIGLAIYIAIRRLAAIASPGPGAASP